MTEIESVAMGNKQPIATLPKSPYFATFLSLFNYIESFHQATGVALVEDFFAPFKNNDFRDALLLRSVTLECDHVSRKDRDHCHQALKNLCPYKVVASCDEATDLWTYETVDSHNHTYSPAENTSQKGPELISPLSFISSGEKREIEHTLAEGPYSLNENVIYDGLTEVDALILLLRCNGIRHSIKYEADAKKRVQGIIWLFPGSVTLWKRFPEVLRFNATNNKNRFGLSLVQVSGITDIDSVQIFAYALIDTEKEDSYLWFCQQLDVIRRDLKCSTPHVIVTEHEEALKKSLNLAFPNTQQQLGIWRVNSDVRAKIKSFWNNEDIEVEIISSDTEVDNLSPYLKKRKRASARKQNISATTHSRDGMFEAWKIVFDASTEADFEASWKSLNDTFPLQQRILNYILEKHMPWRYQWANCFVNKYRNFGYRVVGPPIFCYRGLKTRLETNICSIRDFYRTLETVVESKKDEYGAKSARMSVYFPVSYSEEAWLSDIKCKISEAAFEVLLPQANLAIAALSKNPEPKHLPKCTGRFIQQYALPCAHVILARLEAQKKPQPGDVHPRWWLRKPLVRNTIWTMRQMLILYPLEP